MPHAAESSDPPRSLGPPPSLEPRRSWPTESTAGRIVVRTGATTGATDDVRAIAETGLTPPQVGWSVEGPGELSWLPTRRPSTATVRVHPPAFKSRPGDRAVNTRRLTAIAGATVLAVFLPASTDATSAHLNSHCSLDRGVGGRRRGRGRGWRRRRDAISDDGGIGRELIDRSRRSADVVCRTPPHRTGIAASRCRQRRAVLVRSFRYADPDRLVGLRASRSR